MNRADRRAAAARARRTERTALEMILNAAGRASDAIWDRDGVAPTLAFAIEAFPGRVIVRIGPVDEMLAEFDASAPRIARYARSIERLRRLASADGVLIALAGDGLRGAAYGRRGRYLAEEQLGELEVLSRAEAPIPIGAEA